MAARQLLIPRQLAQLIPRQARAVDQVVRAVAVRGGPHHGRHPRRAGVPRYLGQRRAAQAVVVGVVVVVVWK